jgi:hypothetical protein
MLQGLLPQSFSELVELMQDAYAAAEAAAAAAGIPLREPTAAECGLPDDWNVEMVPFVLAATAALDGNSPCTFNHPSLEEAEPLLHALDERVQQETQEAEQELFVLQAQLQEAAQELHALDERVQQETQEAEQELLVLQLQLQTQLQTLEAAQELHVLDEHVQQEAEQELFVLQLVTQEAAQELRAPDERVQQEAAAGSSSSSSSSSSMAGLIAQLTANFAAAGVCGTLLPQSAAAAAAGCS